MSRVSDVTVPSISALTSEIAKGIKGCSFLEAAAQKYTDIVYSEFEESIILVRLFATVPFGELPAANQRFVTGLAASAGISSLISDQTLVLSLLGTHGQEAVWSDRRNSQGHVGIPLASGDFIDAIPMMSRLLKELGLDLDWITSGDTQIIAKIMGKMAGVFHVQDAQTAVDQKGRKIITAQDFVSAYNVKTVFGVGGAYLTSNGFITNIVFLRETVDRSCAERFIPLVSTFKSGTVHLAGRKRVFAPS